jgi:prepilin-type processing-associated H-X9-DG protein
VDTQGYFPSGGWGRFWTADPNRGFGEKQPGSWIYNILPYIEEQGLRDLGKGLTAGSGGPRGGSAGSGLDAATTTLHQTPIAMFHCPTRRPARPYLSSMANTRYQTWLIPIAQSGGVVKSDYAANTGDAIYWDTVGMYEGGSDYASSDSSGSWTDTTCKTITNPRGAPTENQFCQSGIMFYRSQLKISQISDGTTNTYLVGEKYLNPAAYDGAAASIDPGWDLGENQSMYTGFEWDNHRIAWHPNGQNKETTQPRQDTLGYTNVAAFGSAHAGGLNMAMCDASVQFIGYDIDSDIHRWMANRHDGNVSEYTQ